MGTSQPTKKVHTRGLPTREQIETRCKRLNAALRKLGAAHNIAALTTSDGTAGVIEEFRALRTPLERNSEWIIGCGGDPDATERPRFSDQPSGDGIYTEDDLALLVAADKMRHETACEVFEELERWESDGGRPWTDANDLYRVALGNLHVPFGSLTESGKRQARRVEERWTTRRRAFQERGRPQYRYRSLVKACINHIEQITAHRFQFCHDPPSGPEFEVLRCALDLLLFASGAPTPQALADIVRTMRDSVRQTRRSKITKRRRNRT